MLGLKWITINRAEAIITLGNSIPEVLHRAQMIHGITFLNRIRDFDRWGGIDPSNYEFHQFKGKTSDENYRIALEAEKEEGEI